MIVQARDAGTLDARLAGVQLPDPFDIGLFCERVAAARNRLIHLVPFSVGGPDLPCGLWVGLADADVIFFEQATTPVHRDHFVLHEIGHVLGDHTGRPDALVPLLAQQLPEGLIEPDRLAEAFGLRRASYSTKQEQEAEAFARRVGARVRRTVGGPPLDEGTGRLARAARALGPGRP